MTIHQYKNDLPADFELEGDIAIDTETTGLSSIRDRLCLVQFSNGDGEAHLVNFDYNNYDAPHLKKFLSNKDNTKIFHYARFDVAMIYKFLGVMVENIYCTKIASRLVRTYADSHSLRELCKELLNIQISKQQQCSYWGTEELSQEQLHYAANDVLHLHNLRDALNLMLFREHRTDLAFECFKYIPVRAKLDIYGWSETDIFAHK